MKKPWLLLDCNYLCWRAFYSTGSLSHGPDQTGTLYGFLRDVRTLQDLFNTDKIVFCFDLGKPKRCKIYPAYKANRKQNQKVDAETLTSFRMQVEKLRTVYLKQLGYNNVWSADGYEADDLIARFVFDYACNTVIVSADNDLLQLLRPGVCIYHPQQKQTVTEESFRKQWNVLPCEWPLVKALAGCVTDNIDGIEGVGEKTAAKWMCSKFKPTHKAYQKITNEYAKIIGLNLPLVQLPYPNTPSPKIRSDCVTPAKWRKLADKLGMKTLRDWK